MAKVGVRSLIMGIDPSNRPTPVALDSLGRVITVPAGNRIDKIWTPAVSTTPAYTAADALGSAAATLTNVFSAVGRGSKLRTVTVTDIGKQSAALDILLFHTNPANTTVTDNGALTVHATDLITLLGVVSIAAADYAVFVTNSVATKNVELNLMSNLSTSLWAIALTRGTPTYTGTSDLQIRMSFEQG